MGLPAKFLEKCGLAATGDRWGKNRSITWLESLILKMLSVL
jgi:hypothetical protein